MGSRPPFEVADVVRAHRDDYASVYPLSAAQDKVLRHIVVCRTAALGGHVDVCDRCGLVRPSYNSCRDRHCPKCQASQAAQWLAQREQRLLPVPHFHLVFTIPAELKPLALRNKQLFYNLLFAAVAQTLHEIARDERHLGARIGFTAVLHTWAQNLSFHPHVHCVVTGGGLSNDGTQWVEGRQRYLLPVKVLSNLFRGKLLAALHDAWQNDDLELDGSTAQLADPIRWASLKSQLYNKSWVVYAKAPFGTARHVFRYLGRYTHRVAISNHRIVAFANGKVTFLVRDPANSARNKRLTLDAVEFLRRFLLHTLPKGFKRIRHYGLYAGASVHTTLVAARRLLRPLAPVDDDLRPPQTSPKPWWERFFELTGVDVMACPCCGGRLRRIGVLTAHHNPPDTSARAPPAA